MVLTSVSLVTVAIVLFIICCLIFIFRGFR